MSGWKIRDDRGDLLLRSSQSFLPAGPHEPGDGDLFQPFEKAEVKRQVVFLAYEKMTELVYSRMANRSPYSMILNGSQGVPRHSLQIESWSGKTFPSGLSACFCGAVHAVAYVRFAAIISLSPVYVSVRFNSLDNALGRRFFAITDSCCSISLQAAATQPNH